jgi:hypothetical protein
MLSVKEKLAKNYINSRGWKTNQKYLIIESDDWGAIRMPSKEVYHKLIANDIPVDKFSFDKHDALESEEDLKNLFNTLEKFQDKTGSPAVLTAYHVVANPDFEKIEATARKDYHYETILETYSRFLHTKKVPNLIKEGIEKGIYIPQFHGREHIHVKRWMEAINFNSEKEQLAFQNRAIVSSKSKTCRNPYTKDYFKGFAFSSISEHEEIENIHRDGLKIFKEIFGFPSKTFVAQGTVFGDHILKMLSEEGVQLILGQQSAPKSDNGYQTINKNWGNITKFNQQYWRRNCLFEPARNQNFPWVKKTMEEIEIAFRWGKPAVISAHRENFIGSIFEENRTQSLQKLEILLELVMKKWPDVKFISTAKLAEIMLNQNQ